MKAISIRIKPILIKFELEEKRRNIVELLQNWNIERVFPFCHSIAWSSAK
jgi:hypothetical protein